MALWTKTAGQLLAGYLTVTVLLALFTVYEWRKHMKLNREMIRTHAKIVADDLWEFNEDRAKAYLELAAGANHYRCFDVTLINGASFLHVEGPVTEGLESALVKLKFIPVMTFTSDIQYEKQKIGILQGEQYIRIIYPCFNFMIFLLLLMFTTLFIVHLYENRKKLMHQVEEESRKYHESEHRFQELVNMLPEMVWEADTGGNLTYANKIAFERFGYTHMGPDAMCINLQNFLIPEDRQRAIENYRAAMNGKDLGFNEYTAMTAAGKTFPILIRSVPIIKHDQIIGARGILIDITELRGLKQQLLQAQKLEAIGTMAGGIAHDFNNILAAITGYIQLVQIELSKSNPSLSAKLAEAFKATERARELIHQILTFSRKNEPAVRPVRLSSIVTEAVKLLRSSIPSTIEIRHYINSSAAVLADATRMHQMIMNICTNAYQAIGNNEGILTIRLEEIKKTTGEELNSSDVPYLLLEISDTGCGIDHEILQNIFDPYFTTKSTGEGTGLGLAVVHGIVEEHGGRIEVESRPGQGTMCRIFLPVFQREAAEKEKCGECKPPAGGSESIMVVDDEEQILDITKDFLERMGYRVETFINPVEALSRLTKQPGKFDLVITDQTMPRMTGLQLSEEIKNTCPGCIVILCSGYSATLTDKSLKKAEVDIFLRKPVMLHDMARTIRDLLDHRSSSKKMEHPGKA